MQPPLHQPHHQLLQAQVRVLVQSPQVLPPPLHHPAVQPLLHLPRSLMSPLPSTQMEELLSLRSLPNQAQRLLHQQTQPEADIPLPDGIPIQT